MRDLNYHAFWSKGAISWLPRLTCGSDNDSMRRVQAVNVRRLFERAGRAIEASLMPQRCVFCGVDCENGERFVCIGCADDLPRIDHACPRCAQAAGAPFRSDVTCADCQIRPPPFVAARAPFSYEFPVDAAIKALKFRHKLFYVPALGALLESAFAELPADIDVLLPVPLHWQRHAVRGFNQARELCKPLQKLTGLPILKAVVRSRPTPYQSGLNAKQRRRNLRRVFEVRSVIHATHVLIVDDVITTGETCRELASALLQGGVDKVSVLAVARAARNS